MFTVRIAIKLISHINNNRQAQPAAGAGAGPSHRRQISPYVQQQPAAASVLFMAL